MFGLFKRKKPKEKKVEGYLPACQHALAEKFKSRDKQYARVTYPSRTEPTTEPRRKADGEDFGLSAAIGMATQNPLLGYAAGCSLTGGLVGASISESINSSDTSSTSCASSSSSYDSGSSYDGGSCGGSDSGSW